jgi:hypothetical protein
MNELGLSCPYGSNACTVSAGYDPVDVHSERLSGTQVKIIYRARCVIAKRSESEALMAQPLTAARDSKQFSLQPGCKNINSFSRLSINS